MPTLKLRLIEEQLEVVEYLLEFSKPIQTLGGYAGTGKTTVIKELQKRLPDFAVCAFTGKAAHVLRRKGVPASTIHLLIYKPLVTTQTNGRPGVAWELKDRSDLEFNGFIVDEASMVNRELYDALCSFGLPIIFVGDHGQLEPVGGKNFNLMAEPDVALEKIHRNAGEIAHFADFVRKGNRPASWRHHNLCTGKKVKLTSWADLSENMTEDPDQIICAFNRTRIRLNQLVREIEGLPPDRAVVGDRVMCLMNEHNLGVFNGMQGEVAEIDWDEQSMLFSADGREIPVRFRPEHFNSNQEINFCDLRKLHRLPFDYCYAVTCHKAQGDEWDNVLVVEQRCRGWSHARWAYTAASRARKVLCWIPYEW